MRLALQILRTTQFRRSGCSSPAPPRSRATPRRRSTTSRPRRAAHPRVARSLTSSSPAPNARSCTTRRGATPQQLWLRARAREPGGWKASSPTARRRTTRATSRARANFSSTCSSLPRVAYLLSVANMHLKADAPDVARAFYLRVLQTPHTLPTPPPTEAEAQMARRKLDEATCVPPPPRRRAARRRVEAAVAPPTAPRPTAPTAGASRLQYWRDEVEARGDAAAAEAAEAAAAAAAARMVAEGLAPRLSVGGGGDVTAGAEVGGAEARDAGRGRRHPEASQLDGAGGRDEGADARARSRRAPRRARASSTVAKNLRTQPAARAAGGGGAMAGPAHAAPTIFAAGAGAGANGGGRPGEVDERVPSRRK